MSDLSDHRPWVFLLTRSGLIHSRRQAERWPGRPAIVDTCRLTHPRCHMMARAATSRDKTRRRHMGSRQSADVSSAALIVPEAGHIVPRDAPPDRSDDQQGGQEQANRLLGESRRSRMVSTAADYAGTASHTRRCVMKRVLFSALVVCLALVPTAETRGEKLSHFLAWYAKNGEEF